jgi:hypothetical protein
MGSTGVGGPGHLLALLLQEKTGTRFNLVPYRSQHRLRPLARLAQNEELRCTGRDSRSGGRMGREAMAVIGTT